MKKVKLNEIWNFNYNLDIYRPNDDFINAFSHYVIINKLKKNHYSLKDDLLVPFLSKNFGIEDKVITFNKYNFNDSVGRHHETNFDEKNLEKITKFFCDSKINFAIIDQTNNEIIFENYNEHNGYISLYGMLHAYLPFETIVNNLNEINKKIDKGYRIVEDSSFVELLIINTNEILKVKTTSGFYDGPFWGHGTITREHGEYKGYEYISNNTEVARKMLGLFENDLFNVNGFQYKIVSVKKEEEI